jgi:hypothetical protein
MNYVEIGATLEQQTIRLLKKIGFRDVDGGCKFQIAEKQIDACGGHEDTFLLGEGLRAALPKGALTPPNTDRKVSNCVLRFRSPAPFLFPLAYRDVCP